MVVELLVATGMVMVTVLLHAIGLLLLERLTQFEAMEEEKLFIKALSVPGVLMMMAVVLGLFALHGLEIWLYAILYLSLDAMSDLRTAVYFSTQTYAAIGYGDAAMQADWHLVAAIEGINGLLLIGWSTAFFVTVMKRLSRL
jgi:hypothetical protein